MRRRGCVHGKLPGTGSVTGKECESGTQVWTWVREAAEQVAIPNGCVRASHRYMLESEKSCQAPRIRSIRVEVTEHQTTAHSDNSNPRRQ